MALSIFCAMNSFKFHSCSRVRKRGDFLFIQGSGRKVRTAHFLLLFVKRDGGCRLGITVSTKVDKRAVKRNFIKRRIREVFRRWSYRGDLSLDLVIIAHKGAELLDSTDISAECELLLCNPLLLS